MSDALSHRHHRTLRLHVPRSRTIAVAAVLAATAGVAVPIIASNDTTPPPHASAVQNGGPNEAPAAARAAHKQRLDGWEAHLLHATRP